MAQSVDVSAQSSDAAQVDPARRPLIAMATFGTIAVITGTFLFSYPTTFEAFTRGMIIVHDVSGDLTLVAAVWYLWIHLRRVWRMWRRVLQRWSGYVAVLAWIVAGGSGIYGQIWPMPSESTMGLVHMISAVAATVLACVHGGYGLRRRFQKQT